MKAVMSNVLNEEEEEDAEEEDDGPSSMLEEFFLARVYTNSNAHTHTDAGGKTNLTTCLERLVSRY